MDFGVIIEIESNSTLLHQSSEERERIIRSSFLQLLCSISLRPSLYLEHQSLSKEHIFLFDRRRLTSILFFDLTARALKTLK